MTYEELSPGWAATSLGNLLTVIRGVSYKKRDSRNEFGRTLVPILRATNIGHDLNFGNLVYVPNSYVKPEQMLKLGDIVIAASSGSSSVVGKAAQLRQEWGGSFGAFCFGLRPDKELDYAYIGWFLQTREYRNHISRLAAGVNINNIKREHIEETTIHLPPLAEQRRIVAAIEQHFTRLDAAVAAFERAQANLRRYRASVLKAACEGRLVPTEAELARDEGREYETADALLERILAERRARWEAQAKRRGKYKEPATPDTSELPELPEGWAWASVAQLGEVRLGRQRSPKRAVGPNMRPYLRAANVTWHGLDLSSVKEMDFNPKEFETYRLRKGDILLGEASGSVDEVGKPAIWEGQIDGCCFQNTLIRVRAYSEAVPYLHLRLLSDARSGALGRAARGVGIHHLGAQRAEAWVVALPPLAEQRRIVAEVERRLSVVSQAEAAVEANLARAERLRQSILKRAFAGELVPQDPNDEPASALLARIKAEREAAQAAEKAARKPRRRRSGKTRARKAGAR